MTDLAIVALFTLSAGGAITAAVFAAAIYFQPAPFPIRLLSRRMNAMSAELDALNSQVATTNASIDSLIAITKDSTQVEAIKAELATAQSELATTNAGIVAATEALKAKSDEAATATGTGVTQ